jgi:hypothetical protein
MMAVWPISHAEQLIADLVDGQFIENPVFAQAYHDHVAVRSYLQMAVAEYAFRLAIVVGRMAGGHGTGGGSERVNRFETAALLN